MGAQLELNKKREAEVGKLRKDIEEVNIQNESVLMNLKKKHQDAIQEMTEQIDQLSKIKSKIDKDKSKVLNETNDARNACDEIMRAKGSSEKTNKKYQGQIRDAQGKLEEESRGKAIGHDQLVAADRKAHAMQNALEEARSLLEIADRNRRMTEQELSDSNESLSDATVQNQSIAAAKRKLEAEMQTLNADLDEMSAEAKLCEDKAGKAMVDAARLAEELRGEHDVAQQMEKARKILEAQSKDLQQRLDEAETNALKGGKKAMNKMETRIRELESEMDAENRRQADTLKNLRRSERRINELTFASDEDRKNHERMQSLIDGLQGKIKTYKKQIEEAEEIAALNLAKFRKVAAEADSAAGRADVAEQALAKSRARGRSCSMGPQ